MISCLRAMPLNSSVQEEGLMMLHNMTSGGGMQKNNKRRYLILSNSYVVSMQQKIINEGILDVVAAGFVNRPGSEGCMRSLRQISLGMTGTSPFSLPSVSSLLMLIFIADEQARTHLIKHNFVKFLLEFVRSKPNAAKENFDPVVHCFDAINVLSEITGMERERARKENGLR